MKNREFLTNRICSGVNRIKIRNEIFIYKSPDRNLKCIADEKYQDILRAGHIEGIFTKDELLEKLYADNLWTIDEEEELEKIPKKIEDLKVELFNAVTKSNTRIRIRENLKKIKDRFSELLSKKHQLDYLTCEGMATISKIKFIISRCIFNENLEKILITDDKLLDSIIGYLNSNKLDESDYRDLARNEPWRSTWSLGKANSFGVPIIDLSDEQKTLCTWSKVYDSVYESQECPSDSVIEEDDMLDGWFIVQRRKRQNEQEKNELDGLVGNDKIKNCKEIFIMAQTPDDARKINNLNDPYAKMIKKQREGILAKGQEVSEANLPDVKQDLMMMQQQALSQKFGG